MTNQCYFMVRGSGIRLTDLDAHGRFDSLHIKYAASKAVASVTVNEVIESNGREFIRNDDDEPRLHIVNGDTTLRYEADINFLRCDPSLLNLITGVPIAYNASGEVVGFDSQTRLPLKAFALEVWSKLAGWACKAGVQGFGQEPFGLAPFGMSLPVGHSQAYGYTLFPFLKGGTVGGFSFANGLVSFNVKGARTLRSAQWGVGPYDLEGQYMRLLRPVSRNTQWRSFITPATPPYQQDGITTFADIIDGNVGPDILDGNTGPWIVSGN